MRRGRARTLPYRLNETRKDKDDKRDNRGREAIDAERPYDECLNGYGIEREGGADESDNLEGAAQKLVEDDNLKRGKDEEDSVEQNAELGDRYAENVGILARGDDITAGEILDVAEKWRAA